ncbi:hypothetical protein V2G26_001426 [Clonostachys chloroleuca]
MSATSLDGPPSGTPEYDAWAAQDKGPSISITCWLFISLAAVFVFARLFVRLRVYKKLMPDDYWCLAGLVCGFLSTTFSQLAVENGNGKHYQLLSDERQEKVILWTIVAFCPGVLCFGFPKLAVAHLLIKLMNPGKYHRWFLWGMVIWCLLTLFATIGTLLGQCQPANSQWNFDIKGECVPKHHIVNFSLYAGAYSAFVDIYLAVYPAIVLFQLQLKLKKKIALSIALGIGCVSGAVALYKTTRIPKGLASPDFSYESSDLVIWTVIEGSTIIMACTIPVLSPLMDMIFGHNPFSSSRRKTSSYEAYKMQPRSGLGTTDTRGRQSKPPTQYDLEKTAFDDRDGSQEIIISGRSNEPSSSDRYPLQNFSRPSGSTPPEGHIMRTDEIEVSYDNQAVHGRSRI